MCALADRQVHTHRVVGCDVRKRCLIHLGEGVRAEHQLHVHDEEVDGALGRVLVVEIQVVAFDVEINAWSLR